MQEFETYEQVAAFLINELAHHFGLDHVEGKQIVRGNRSGTDWEIDAKGIRIDNAGFVIIECRRHTTSGLRQEAIGGVAYRIHDTGAVGGIVVSPLGLQEGANMVAKAESIISIRLDANSTRSDYVLEFLGRVMIGASVSLEVKAGIKLAVNVVRHCQKCGLPFEAKDKERICGTCLDV
jgi:hypothetical protein